MECSSMEESINHSCKLLLFCEILGLFCGGNMGSFPSITVKVVSEQLLHMCERGDSTAVASLLHNSAKTYSERIMCEIINARHYVQISPVLCLGKREVTALLLACQLGFEDVVRVLLQYNVWVNTHPCPLNVACANGHVGVVKALLTCPYLMVQGVGGSATIYDWGHCPPLFDACRHGHAEIAQLLLEHGADPNDPYVYALSESEYDCLHPLQAACHCSYTEVVPVLLNHGANIPAGLLKIGSCPASVQNILVSYIEEKDFVKLARASKLTMLMGHHPRTGRNSTLQLLPGAVLRELLELLPWRQIIVLKPILIE